MEHPRNGTQYPRSFRPFTQKGRPFFSLPGQLALGLLFALSLLPLPSLAASPQKPRQEPVHFLASPDGKLEVDGLTFGSMSEYFQSPYFKAYNKRCGTMGADLPARLMATPSHCSLASTTIDNEYWPGDHYVIPVVFHVISNTAGTGNISDAMINSQIDVLNEDYGGLPNTPGAQGFDTHIRFRLAGITRTQNDNWFNDKDESVYKSTLGWDRNKYLNIWVNTASGYLGYSYFPQDSSGDNLDGVVVLYSAVGRDSGSPPYDKGRTLTHEIGHYLGLYHTFDGGCANSYTSGDLLVDTNPEQDAHYGCQASSSCSLPDPIDNYMDYTDDTCMQKFTPEQGNRMMCALMSYRSTLYSIEFLGDLNKDAVVSSADLSILQNYLANNLPSGSDPFSADFYLADFDGNRKVESADLLALTVYLTGNSHELRP